MLPRCSNSSSVKSKGWPGLGVTRLPSRSVTMVWFGTLCGMKVSLNAAHQEYQHNQQQKSAAASAVVQPVITLVQADRNTDKQQQDHQKDYKNPSHLRPP